MEIILHSAAAAISEADWAVLDHGGFEPVPTWSAFWIRNSGMRRAVADFIARENSAMQDYAAETAAHLPFKPTA